MITHIYHPIPQQSAGVMSHHPPTIQDISQTQKRTSDILKKKCEGKCGNLHFEMDVRII